MLNVFCIVFLEGDNVIIVIGGDDEYKDEREEDKAVLSRWARRKVSSQFQEEYLDGRKSFIFSWDKKHREIHVEALLHFFDSNKKGEKFEPPPRLKKPTQSDNPSSEKAGVMPQKDEVINVTNRNLILSAWLIKKRSYIS